MDLSKFSTEDLQALRSKDLSKVSDSGLQTLRNQTAQVQGADPKVPGSPPEGHEDNPLEADLYGSDLNRTKASFGDIAGVSPLLQANGFSDVKKNQSGDLVAKAPNGKFYKDQTGLMSHPINWLESKAGGSLPTTGMIGGALLGEGLFSIPTAGAGSAVGEGARIALGKKLGVYQGGAGQAAMDVASEGVKGTAAEVGGKVIGKMILPGTGKSIDAATKAGLEKLVGAGKRAATGLSEKLTGVDADAFLRQMDRPNQVKNSLVPGNALRVARQGQDELAARASQEGAAISQARKDFLAQHGSKELDTSPMISSVDESLAANAPNSSGRSGMTPQELSELSDLQKKDLTTTIPGDAMQGQRPQVIPKKSIQDLRGTTDYLQEQVSPKAYTTVGPTRSGKSQGTYQRLLGQLKDAFHETSPELGAADARFSDYANKAKILGPIENDAAGESFASNLFGQNKGARQEAAKALIPNTYEEMADIGARKAMNTDSRLSKFGPSAPAILRGGVGLGSGMAGFAASGGSLEGGLMGLAGGTGLAIATSPSAHQQLYYLAGKYGMPIVKALMDNPQIAPAILDSQDLNKMKTFGQNIWSQMQGENKNE